jgi:hypothetical protein
MARWTFIESNGRRPGKAGHFRIFWDVFDDERRGPSVSGPIHPITSLTAPRSYRIKGVIRHRNTWDAGLQMLSWELFGTVSWDLSGTLHPITSTVRRVVSGSSRRARGSVPPRSRVAIAPSDNRVYAWPVRRVEGSCVDRRGVPPGSWVLGFDESAAAPRATVEPSELPKTPVIGLPGMVMSRTTGPSPVLRGYCPASDTAVTASPLSGEGLRAPYRGQNFATLSPW